MADASVLREYLVALGFRVNETESKNFDNKLAAWDKRANVLGKALVGVGVAAVGMVAQFTVSMEKLYFASKRTDSAVGSIQALEYGASRVGVSGDKMRGSLEAMARNMRANPGLQGLLNSLGVRVEGRDKADVLTDLVAQLQKMPFYVAQQYGSMFGINPDDLFLLQEGLAEMKKAQAERKQWAADMGVDGDAAAAAAHQIANEWREVSEKAGIFKDALTIAILPGMLQLSAVTKELLSDWTKLIMTQPQQGSLLDRFAEGIGLKTPDKVELSAESKRRLGIGEEDSDTYTGTNLGTGEKAQFKKKWLDRQMDRFKKWGGAKNMETPLADQASVDAAQDTSAFNRGGKGGSLGPSYVPNGRGGYTYQPQAAANDPGASGEAAALFARLEQKYALTPGTLDRLWKTETSRGKNLTGPETKYGKAKGHFQFLDATGQDYGLDEDGGRKDRDDLEKSATAAARYFSDLKAKYGGNDRKAAAAYNWGMGNVDKFGLGAAPKQTRDYMDAVAPQQTITQENNVHIHGVESPARAADAVREEMKSSNADLVRNMKVKVQ